MLSPVQKKTAAADRTGLTQWDCWKRPITHWTPETLRTIKGSMWQN